jgi:hypothetical protein
MDGNDFNLITPVNSLQNIGSMTPIERHQKRKQRKKESGDDEAARHRDTQEDGIDADQLLEEFVSNNDDPHSIDYKA